MGFVVDFSQLEGYVKSMKVSQRDFESFLYNFLLRMAEEVIRETKPKTPVDTGALRASWAVEKTEKSSSTAMLKGKTGQMAKRTLFSQSGSVVVSGKGKLLSVVISNPQEYATEVEFGCPKKKNGVEVGWRNGVFMMTTSIENVQKRMPSAYETAFNEFCRRHGIA